MVWNLDGHVWKGAFVFAFIIDGRKGSGEAWRGLIRYQGLGMVTSVEVNVAEGKASVRRSTSPVLKGISCSTRS